MDYYTIEEEASAEIVEKKSRFIAELFPVDTEEQAVQILEKVKKQYWDARHHCWAYIIGEEMPVERCSDDGEPSGTAGKPILEVIRGKELRNVLLVVTRYFGGTLLGTGGLVRAYSQASQDAVTSSCIVSRVDGYLMRIETDYTGLGKIQYYLAQNGIDIQSSEYTENVTIKVMIPKDAENKLIKNLTEITNGQAFIEREEECRYSMPVDI